MTCSSAGGTEEGPPTPKKALHWGHQGQDPLQPEGRGLQARGRDLSRSWAGRTLAGAGPGRRRKATAVGRAGAGWQGGWGCWGRGQGSGSPGCAGQRCRLSLTGYGLHLVGPPLSGLPGGPPDSGRSRPPRGCGGRTASQHQLPLSPRAPPLGGNGQRACARTVCWVPRAETGAPSPDLWPRPPTRFPAGMRSNTRNSPPEQNCSRTSFSHVVAYLPLY